MTETFRQQLTVARQKLEETKLATSESRKDIFQKIETLSKLTSQYEESWGGDWIENTNVYSTNFKLSTGEWIVCRQKK